MLPVSVGKTVKRSTDSLTVISSEFESFVELLDSVYGTTLTRPQFVSLAQVSKFCTGLIEGDESHLWKADCRKLSAQSRFGLAHSLFLFRKVVPKKKPRVEDYVDLLGSAQELPDPDFLEFAKKETRRLFPWGWDRVYQDRCLTSSLPLSACAESGRSQGGSRSWVPSCHPSVGRTSEVYKLLGLNPDNYLRMNRAEFCEYVLKSVVPAPRGVSKVKAIETGGKWRVISIPPRVDNYLRPLHQAIHHHLAQKDWYLVGDAKPARFKEFTPVEGEQFESGDYESATDNLNAVLQTSIMSELLQRSYTVPQGVREHALAIYKSSLACYDRNGKVTATCTQARGQLMGQLTSFPLLSLVNYITFRYSIRRPVPVRINGDDIVFRATPAECSLWERNVAKGGLVLSKGKTLVHRRAFTLNSTPFWSSHTKPVAVGFIRPKSLIPHGKQSDRVSSMSGRYYSSCSGFGRMKTRTVRAAFLALNQKSIHLSRRSVTRGLGLAADREMLHASGLWHRELFYLEQVLERPLPCLDASLPVGWVQISSNWLLPEGVKDWERRWSDACVDHAWTGSFNPVDFSEDSLIRRIRDGCSPYGMGTLMSTRVRRMIGMSRSVAWKWVNLRRNESVFGRVQPKKGKRVWVEVDLLASRTQIDFVAALA